MDEPQVVTVESSPTAVVRGTVPADQLPAFFDAAFQRLPAAIAAQGAQIAGAAFARYPSPPGDVVELEVGFPVDRPIEATDDVGSGSLPAGRVARVVHAGSFEELGTSWERLQVWMDEQGHRRGARVLGGLPHRTIAGDGSRRSAHRAELARRRLIEVS